MVIFFKPSAPSGLTCSIHEIQLPVSRLALSQVCTVSLVNTWLFLPQQGSVSPGWSEEHQVRVAGASGLVQRPSPWPEFLQQSLSRQDQKLWSQYGFAIGSWHETQPRSLFQHIKVLNKESPCCAWLDLQDPVVGVFASTGSGSNFMPIFHGALPGLLSLSVCSVHMSLNLDAGQRCKHPQFSPGEDHVLRYEHSRISSCLHKHMALCEAYINEHG